MRAAMRKTPKKDTFQVTNDEQICAITDYYSSKKDKLGVTEVLEEKKLKIEERKLAIYENEAKQKSQVMEFEHMKMISDYNFEQLKKRIELKKMDASYDDEQLKLMFPTRDS